MATWRRRAWVVIVGVVTLGALGSSTIYYRNAFPGMPDEVSVTVVTLLVSLLHYAACDRDRVLRPRPPRARRVPARASLTAERESRS